MSVFLFTLLVVGAVVFPAGIAYLILELAWTREDWS